MAAITDRIVEIPTTRIVTQSAAHITELDGLRGLAALAVALAHFPAATDTWLGRVPTWLNSVSAANLAVVFFYSLSAFLLTYHACVTHRRTGTFDTRGFYVRRAFRIWPLYFAVALADVMLAYPTLSPAWPSLTIYGYWQWLTSHIWLYALFLGNWSLAFYNVGGYVDFSPGPFRVLWSIAVEWQFYLLFPLLVVPILGRPHRVPLLVATLIVLGTASRLIFMVLPVSVNPGSAGGLYYATTSYLDVFGFGIAAGYLAADPSERAESIRSLLRGPAPLIFLVQVFLVMGSVWPSYLWWPYSIGTAALYGLTGLTFATVILWAACNPTATICRVLRSRQMQLLGLLSYGVYVWHPLAMSVVPDKLGTVTLLLCIIVTFVVASAGYLLIERPFLLLKARASAQSGGGLRLRRATRLLVGPAAAALMLLVAWMALPPIPATYAQRAAERQAALSAAPSERDALRRRHLAEMSAALTAFRAANGRYPCTTDAGWQWSDAPSENWLLDEPSACNAASAKQLAPDYIAQLPVDPRSEPGGPFWGGGFTYGYRGTRAGCQPGQWYIVAARVEEPDPNRPPIKDCDGSVIPWPSNIIAVTSAD